MVFFGIYGNNRNPRDEKMAKKKKNVLCIKTKLFIVPPFRKKRDYTLTTGLYNTFER